MGVIRGLVLGGLLYTGFCAALVAASILTTPPCDQVTGRHDFAIVLAAGQNDAVRLTRESRDRLDAAVGLFRRGRVDALMTTGQGASTVPFSDGERIAQVAIDLGVPADKVSWEGDARSTLQNALFSLSDLPPDASLIVVTSGYHALRGHMSFAWAGRAGAYCASTSWPNVPRRAAARIVLREVAAWGLNIPRAAIWWIAERVGVQDALPDAFLA